MPDDIVQCLRSLTGAFGGSMMPPIHPAAIVIVNDAAREIERLRAELAEAKPTPRK
jgi:hypothetical protein